MKKGKNWKKGSKPLPPALPLPPVPPPIAALPQPKKSIAPKAANVQPGKGNRGTLARLPDMQSLLSGTSSRVSGGSVHSKTSGGDNPEDAAAANGEGGEHHHHSFPHPNLDGLDIFKRRERSGGRHRHASTDSEGRARVLAPKTLVITMDSKLEEKMEAHGNILRRRLQGSERDDMAFEIITNQIHDLGDLEWMLDEESKILLRRHVIYWKCALSMPRRKMQIKDTNIPLAATKALHKPLRRCQRCNRSCIKCCCCSSRRSEMTEDLTRTESLETFQNKAATLEKSPSTTDNAKGHLRREIIFDSQAPSYAAYMASPIVRGK